MINTIVVEDYDIIREKFIEKLENRFEGRVKVIESSNNVSDAIEKINALKPDLIFLDVELPDGTGFDIIENLDFKPLIILVTASMDYGVQAVNKNVFYYITKPILNSELDTALSRVENALRKGSSEIREDQKVLTVSTADGYSRILHGDILFCHSQGAYSIITLLDKKEIVISKSLKILEQLIADASFIRISKYYLVNKRYVIHFDRDGYIHLTTGETLQVSTRKRNLVKDLLFSN